MLKGAPAEEEELWRREEALTMEAAERNLSLKRLETREHQVTQAEDDVGAREARIQEEVDRRMQKFARILCASMTRGWS